MHFSGCPVAISTPTGQPQRKPVEQMYSASDAVHLAVVDRRIKDVAVVRHQRLDGRSRAGTAALVHVDSCTLCRRPCKWLTLLHWANAPRCEEAATSLGRTSLCRWPPEPQRSTLVATCLSSLSVHMPGERYSNRRATLRMRRRVWLQFPRPVNVENADTLLECNTFDRTNRRVIAMMFVRLSIRPTVRPSGTGVHCDHTVQPVSADLSLWLDRLMFWAP